MPACVLLTTAPLPKHDPEAALPEAYRVLAAADIAYRRGDTLPAKECWRQTDASCETKLSSASLATATAISDGDYALYYEIESFLKKRASKTVSERERALPSLPQTLAAMSMAAPGMAPEWRNAATFRCFRTN